MSYTLPLKFASFDTYYVYELDNGRAFYMPNLPCLSCGSPGMVFVMVPCAKCGAEHYGAYCADSYASRVGGTDLQLNAEVLTCRKCELFESLAQALLDGVDRQGSN